MGSERVIGSEHELAVVVHTEAGVRPAPAELSRAIVREVASPLPHALGPAPIEHAFFGNGSCVYCDAGGHPEVCSGECRDPHAVAAQVLAMEAEMVRAVRAVSARYGLATELIKNNLDYRLGGSNTYGHHQNTLLEEASPREATVQLAPLLAAMPLLCGAGRVSFAGQSAGFELSQRAGFMNAEYGSRTQSSRAMVTRKDDPLSKHGDRLHIIAFDSVLNSFQMVLAPGVIALTALLIDEGQELAPPVRLRNTIKSLQAVSCDPSLTAQLPLAAGGTTTALAIQRHYWELVRRRVASGPAPDWADAILDMWRDALDGLQRDPFALADRLDWVAKLLLLTRELQEQELGWAEYSRWQYVVASVRRLKASFPDLAPLRLTSTAEARQSITQSALGVLDRHMTDHQLSWRDFPRIWNAVNQLCRRCLDFHVLREDAAPRGPVTAEQVRRARTEPPAGTRAELRGRAITEGGAGQRAYWNYVQRGERRLRLDHPLGEGAEWTSDASAQS